MPEKKQKINRREFIFRTGIFGALGLAILTFVRNIVLYLFPERKTKTYHKYLVAREDELAVGRAKQIYMGRTPVFIVRQDEGFKVFSGICTHLGCIVKWEQDKERFFCPCHKGVFDKSGKVVSGPPPRPLDEFRVEIENKKVYVFVEDKTRSPWA
ncbi:MAG: Rieske (2Fe-2S) protein [Calditrichaeota bacterium]|nr:Rieske (2Fe-2S) protein [Calditrichota bacterium]